MILIKKTLYTLIDDTPTATPIGKWVNRFLFALVILNVISIVLESEPYFALRYTTFFSMVELFSIAIYTLEYILRLITHEFRVGTAEKSSMWRYIFTPLAIIDLITLLPFYLPFIFSLDLRIIRALKLLRVFRVFKLTRYINAINLMYRVLRQKQEELQVISFLFFILVLIFSTLTYYIEQPRLPEVYSSIGKTMWITISSLFSGNGNLLVNMSIASRLINGIFFLAFFIVTLLLIGVLTSAFFDTKNESRPE